MGADATETLLTNLLDKVDQSVIVRALLIGDNATVRDISLKAASAVAKTAAIVAAQQDPASSGCEPQSRDSQDSCAAALAIETTETVSGTAPGTKAEAEGPDGSGPTEEPSAPPRLLAAPPLLRAPSCCEERRATPATVRRRAVTNTASLCSLSARQVNSSKRRVGRSP